MAKKNRHVRLLTAILAAVMLISTVLSVSLSASGTTYYGSSPSISNVTGSLDVGTENLLDESVMYKLPDTIKSTDDISIIVQMKSDALLDAYDKSGSKLSFTEYSLTNEAKSVREDIDAEAKSLINNLKGVDYQLGESFNVVISGFEIIIEASDFETVCRSLAGDAKVIVGEVYEACETELVENKVNVYDTGIFNSDSFQQQFGYDGTGMVVAVLDTGVDYYHSAFNDNYYTADRDRLGLTLSQVSALIANNDMAAEKRYPGLTAEDVYISDKIPFGFDYADNDPDVFPILSNHGTHVAGVIAGNRLEHIESDDYSGEFKGVAPGAQVAAMKIFSDTEATSHSSWIISALEDCVTLGVDVINMSIGTACGFSRETDRETLSGVYDKIRERGISLVVAASNSFNSAYSSEKNGNLPLTSNPDSGTVGSPSTYKGALCVASIEGAKTPYLTYNGSIMYFTESNDRFSEEKDFVNELIPDGQDSIEMEYVLIAGAGRTEADYTGIDVTGKIALIKRGYNTFEEKAILAEKMGAAGVIIYNNVSGDIRMNVGEVEIAVCSISQNDGEELAKAGSGKLVISRSQTSGPFISDFSSWGPSPDLEIKPEITAHGGSILSSVPGESYDRISGTSMATPNVSGVTALLREYVFDNMEKFGCENAVDVTAVINRLLMSTADITLGKNGLPYAVRKQGAGLANLTDSAATNAYIATYNKDGSMMDKSKIELGDDPAKTGIYTLNFGIVNFGTSTLSYNLDYYVLTEGVSETKTAQGETTVTEEAYELKGAKVDILSVTNGTRNGNTISVEAGKTASVSIRITLSDADKKYLNDSFENGMYVEGFIMLDNEDDVQDLSFPYLAFYGDWTQAPMFDLDYFETNADELDDSIDPLDKTLPDAYATRPIGGSVGDYVSYLGSYFFEQNPQNKLIAADRKYIAISNQNTNSEINSVRFVWAGLLRNAERVEIVITEDSTGEVVYQTTDYDIKKSYGDGGAIRPANIDVEFSAIDMNLKNNTKYTVSMKGYLDYGDGGENTNLNNEFSFPITTDFSAPVLSDCEFFTEYDRSTKTNRLYARMAIYDNHYSMALQAGYVGITTDPATGAQTPMFFPFDQYATPIYSEFNSTTYVQYELTDYIDEILSSATNPNTFTIATYDYAMNSATYEIALPDKFEAFGFNDGNGGITQELHITLSPNEVYSLAPIVYPATEWGELITYTNTYNSKAINIVNNKIVAIQSGGATVTARTPDGQTATIKVTILKEGDEGYKEYSKPVADSFSLTGYYVNKAFYILDNTQRDIGSTGNEMKFSTNYYALSMYPSESVTLRYELDAYFPNATSVEFSSGNEDIVKVDKDGRITAVNEGIASITAKVMMDGKSTLYSANVSINVKEPFITSGPSLVNYYGAGDAANHVRFPSSLAITEIGQFAFSNYDYVDKGPDDEISDEAPETMKMWFLGDNTIKSVTIPEGVKRIGAYAFANLTALEEVTLPSTLETIDYGAFYGCINLKKVNGIENVKFINQSAFRGCSISGDLNLASAVAIGDFAFAEYAYYDSNGKLAYSRNQFESLTLSESCKSIGAYALSDNKHLTEITIHSDFLKLGQYAFDGCSMLEKIDINAAVIPTGTFNECKALKDVTLGKDVAVISEYAFRSTDVDSFKIDAENLYLEACDNGRYITNKAGNELVLVSPTATSFTLNNSDVTTVGVGAFSSSKYISSITIPSVTVVRDFGFSECEALKEVNLGALTDVGRYAFEKTSIESFELSNNMNIGEYAFSRSAVVNLIIGDGMVIPNGAFYNCESLTSIVIGDNVTIGNYAFYNDKFEIDSRRETVTLYDEKGSTYNEEWMIYFYVIESNITSLTIGDGAIIGDGAFYGAGSLESVTLGSGARIGDRAFYNCDSLSNIDLSLVISIGDAAFSGDVYYEYTSKSMSLDTVFINSDEEYSYTYNNPDLTEINLSSIQSLGSSAFAMCKDLTKVTLGEGLSHIPEAAFQYCYNLKEINLENVTTVDSFAFAECALSSVNLANATKIGDYSFCYNAEMLSATLGAEKMIIGEGAFSYCEGLVTLIGEEKAIYVGDFAFACTLITEADLSNAEYLGEYAFYKDEPTVFNVILTTALKDIGDNPFANCVVAPFSSTVTESFLDKEFTKVIYTFDLSDSIKIIEGSIYKVVPKGLELICWTGDNTAIVADGTVRISAMAFAGSDVRQVILPSTVAAIGHKAFFGCDKLIFITFASYNAPILEEEYDYEYFASMENIPAIGEYTFTDYYGKPVEHEGMGVVPYFMWNVTDLPANIFYGANFIDYVGHVEDKITMIRPSNGKYYDSFIFNQYFNLQIDGASAADDTTLAAIEAIKKLPTNTKDITLSHKALVEAARSAYNKIMSDEQRALVPGDVLTILTNAEQRISDLEFLMSEPEDEPIVDGTDKVNINLVINIVIGVIFILVVAAFVVVLIIFIKLIKNHPELFKKPEEEKAEIDPEVEKARLAEIAKYVEASRPSPAPKIPKKAINKAPEVDKLVEKHREDGKKLNLPVIIAIAAAAVILIAGIIWAAVGGNDSPFHEHAALGYDVSVSFDSNGGTFKGSNSSIIDLFDSSKIGEDGIKLLSPDDSKRGKGNTMTLTRAGYFFAGWYRERALIDPNNPDMGYTYAGKWDFETDRLMLESGKTYSAEESALTLYAAWVPYYEYEIYTKDENGSEVLLSTVSAINLEIPKWNPGDVTLNMGNFPVREGYTLDTVDYSASNVIVNDADGIISITGQWDESTATLITPKIKLYTTWQEGDRYRIYSTDDLLKNATSSGYYEIYADLDFEGIEWPNAFANDKFNGRIFGNGHTISNVSFESSSRSRINNGLFSSIDGNAYIENLTFENLTHTINLVSVAPGATFGLLAGMIADEAEFNNVNINGKILIGDSCESLAGSTDYSIGLVTGSGNATGISSEISVEKANPGNDTFEIEISDEIVSIVKGSN